MAKKKRTKTKAEIAADNKALRIRLAETEAKLALREDEPAEATTEQAPEASKRPIEKRVYFSKAVRHDYHFSRATKEKPNAPVKVYSFHDHRLPLTKPEEQAELESHPDFNHEFWLAGSQAIEPRTQYVDGIATAASETARGK